MADNNAKDILSDLTLRSFPQLLVSYVVVGWFVMELFGFLAETYGFDQRLVRFFTTLVIAGAPVFAILAWFHGEKGKQQFSTPELVLLLVTIPAAGIAGWYSWQASDHSVSPVLAVTDSSVSADTGTSTRTPRETGAQLTTIAVMPFTKAGEGVEDFVPDGIVTEVLARLSQLSGVNVIARDLSYNLQGDFERTPAEIGRRLNVTHYIEGSVQKSGNRSRVFATLINTASGNQVWSNRYDTENPDVFDLQDRIASDVARSLSLGLGEETTLSMQRRDARAFELFAEARGLFNTSRQEELIRSVELYKQALAIEPDYSLALAGLIDSYILLGFNYVSPSSIMADAQAAVYRANEHPETAAVQRSLGFLHLVTGNFPKAETSFLRALQLDPENATSHYFYSSLLTYMGRLQEAEVSMQKARKLDPLSVESLSWMALLSYYWRRYDDSIETANRVIAFNPSFPRIYLWRGLSHEMLGQYEKALRDYDREIGVSTGAQILSVRPLTFLGQDDKAADRLNFLESIRESSFVDPFRMAQAYLAIGDTDRAFEYLQWAREDQSFHLITLHVEPMFDNIRNDPRFIEIVEQSLIINP